MTKTPIGILAFNRSDYLELTLKSLAGQAGGALDGREVHLFQDGVLNPISGKRYAADATRDENVALFSKIFPKGVVHAQADNLGIARHFDFIERYFFETRDFAAAMFFEDDLLLHPDYLNIMDRLLLEALSNEKVGYVAAYGDHRAPLAEQLKHLPKLIEMRHKWGFGLTRRQWLRQRPLVQEYLTLIADSDYQMRDGVKIVDWLISKKLVPGGTSQDGIKDVAMFQSGATKLMTYCCYGKYIGKKGVHSTETFYGAEGFASTELCPRVAAEFHWPTNHELDRAIADRCRAFADNVNRVSEIFSFYKKTSVR
jgi:hypothetical protein